MKPIHEQCVLDTCWMGWIPKVWKTILIKWLKIVKKESSIPLRVQQELREKIFDCYKKLRYAVFQRAEFLQIVTREDISITKKELRARFVDTASIPGEGRRDDESCDTDGIIDIDFRFDEESVDSELSIDLEETLEEEIAEEDETSYENGAEEPREKAHAKKGKINCTHGRCVIARHIRAVHGRVHMEGQKCGMCTFFYNDLVVIKQWEKKLLGWTRSPELLGFVEKPSKKTNLVALEKFILEHIINDDQKKCFPRWLNNIANTLLLETRRKSTAKGIDTPISGSKAKGLRSKSERMCECTGAEAEEETTEDTIGGFPYLCGRCGHLRRTPIEGRSCDCKACGSENLSVKMSPSGVCHSCQLTWLLKKNSTKTRVETALERATAEGPELEETVAREMLEEENGITDTRLIPRSGEGGRKPSGAAGTSISCPKAEPSQMRPTSSRNISHKLVRSI